jgi:hypothetical protein
LIYSFFYPFIVISFTNHGVFYIIVLMIDLNYVQATPLVTSGKLLHLNYVQVYTFILTFVASSFYVGFTKWN